MANVIKPKRSSTSSSVPTTSNLADGEIAVNTADQKIYMRSGSNIITVADVSSASSGLSNVVEDTTPQLGGNLDLNSSNITGTGEIDVTGKISSDTGFQVDAAFPYITLEETDTTDLNTRIQNQGGVFNIVTTNDAGSSETTRLSINHSTGVAFFNGNITLTGGATVDGREVSTDGTKLDTIATNADVTPSWVPSSDPGYVSNVVEDTTPQLGGDLDTNGNNINFGDNDKANYGADADLEIYHSSSDGHSYIHHTKAAQVGFPSIPSDLILKGNFVRIQNEDGDDLITATSNVTGGTKIYHEGSLRIETEDNLGTRNINLKIDGNTDVDGIVYANGLDLEDNHYINIGVDNDLRIYHDGANSYITDNGTGSLKIGGTVEMPDGVSVTGNFTLTATDDGSAAAPEIDLVRNSASPADADYLGQIKFTGENDADESILYAKITGKISDASDTTEDGLIEYAVKKAGTNTIVQRLTGTALKLINGTGLEVAGNITVDGTVDGRDVATDGTKLDGIEAGATADQTKSDIDALGIDAATLDGVDSTSFLRSDANDTATGALTIGNAIYGNYTSSNTDITGLVSGSTFGSLIQSNNNAHLVVGIRDNDAADSFAVISGSGNYSTDTTYDKLVFQAKADGTLTANGGNTIWHAGNDGSGSGLDADLLDGAQGSLYARLASPTFTGTPAAPTASTGTNTTQLATTAFVQQEIAALKALLYAYDQS